MQLNDNIEIVQTKLLSEITSIENRLKLLMTTSMTESLDLLFSDRLEKMIIGYHQNDGSGDYF